MFRDGCRALDSSRYNNANCLGMEPQFMGFRREILKIRKKETIKRRLEIINVVTDILTVTA